MASSVPTDKEYDVFIAKQEQVRAEFLRDVNKEYNGNLALAEAKAKIKEFGEQQTREAIAYKTGKPADEIKAPKLEGEKSDAYEAGKADVKGVVEGTKGFFGTAIDSIKSIFSGDDDADSAGDSATDTLKKKGKGFGDRLAEFFKNTGWKGMLGMLLGGGAGYAISGIFGGGIMGTILAVALVPMFALMGRDVALRSFGGDDKKAPDGASPALQQTQGQFTQVSTTPPSQGYANNVTYQPIFGPSQPLAAGPAFTNSRTSAGVVLPPLPTSERFPTANHGNASFVTPSQTNVNSAMDKSMAPLFPS